MAKKLTRSTNKMIGGVCAGLAEYFDLDVTLIRVLYLILTLFSAAFPGVILYIILLLIIPEAAPAAPKANNVEDVEFTEAEPKKGAKKK